MARGDDCARVAQKVLLAHSTGVGPFAEICADGRILSSLQLHNAGIPRFGRGVPQSEQRLGTEDYVFLYVAPFRFPDTECGFLFHKNLEIDRRDVGLATPFDTGGLINHLRPHDTDEGRRLFLARHDLPIPDYRAYLEKLLYVCFADPQHYLDGTGPDVDIPIDVNGGDMREWTFEVRIESEVSIRLDLQAVFVSIAGSAETAVVDFLVQCEQDGVDIENWSSFRSTQNFREFKARCLSYIRNYVGR